jgi:uncharacterized membrane protein
MSSTLLALAEKYVTLETEIADVRREMLLALSNGHDPAPRPTKARSSRPGMLQRSAERDQQALDLIRAQPGLRTAELARRLDGAKGTVANRLERLQAKGLVQRDANGAWSSISTPA